MGKIIFKFLRLKIAPADLELYSVYRAPQHSRNAVYQEAAMQWAKEKGMERAIPAGMLYYHIDDPIVDKGGDTEVQIQKKLIMNGLVNAKEEALIAQDNSFYTAGADLELYSVYRAPQHSRNAVYQLAAAPRRIKNPLAVLLCRPPHRIHKQLIALLFEEALSVDNAKKLYGETLYGSVTRLEQYAACAFAHFLVFGLNVEERAEYQIGMPDIGTVYHNALQYYSAGVKESGYDWHTIPEKESDELLMDAVRRAAKEYGEGIFSAKSAGGLPPAAYSLTPRKNHENPRSVPNTPTFPRVSGKTSSIIFTLILGNSFCTRESR